MCQETPEYEIDYSDVNNRIVAFSLYKSASIFMIDRALCTTEARRSLTGTRSDWKPWCNSMRRYKMFLCKHTGKTPLWCVQEAPTRPPPIKHGFSWGEGAKISTKNAPISPLCWSRRWTSSKSICIHINIHTVVPESRPVAAWEKKNAADVALSPNLMWRCYHFAVISVTKWILPSRLIFSDRCRRRFIKYPGGFCDTVWGGDANVTINLLPHRK